MEFLETLLRHIVYDFSMTAKDFQVQYASYLLRIWCETNNGSSVWRGSLEDPATGDRIGFANLEQLFDFLRQVADRGISEE